MPLASLAPRERRARRWQPLIVPCLFALSLGALQLLHRQPIVGTVENDFPVHAARSASWANVFAVDGLHPIGYPFLLRLTTLAVGDVFGAARLLALLGGVFALLIAHRLGTSLHSRRVGLGAQAALAVNWHFQETALLVGSDQVASAFALLAALAATRALAQPRPAAGIWLAAGALMGLAALLRHTALVLAPAFALAVAWRGWRDGRASARGGRRLLAVGLLWLGGLGLGQAPQLLLSWTQTGTPFHQEQARNVWFGLHGQWNWENWPRSDRPPTLGGILRDEPRALLSHWGNESVLGVLRYALMSSGALPPSLARRAPAPVTAGARLLTLAALAAALASCRRGRWRRIRDLAPRALRPPHLFLLLVAAGWVAAVGLAFSTSRYLLTGWIVFFLYAARLLSELARPDGPADRRWRLAVGVWLVSALGNAVVAVALTLGPIG